MRTVEELRDIALELFVDAEKLRKLDQACRVGMAEWTPNDAYGKIMATLFFEPSTRTRFSFETAMKRLGGRVITANDETSSLMKGESMVDTLETVACFADLLVVRSSEHHNTWGWPECVVINAGDGCNSHPTQALLDAYTIWRYKGQLSPLTIGIVGDLACSRSISSLVKFLYPGANCFMGHDSGGNDGKLIEPIPHQTKCHTYNDIERFEEMMPQFDVLYLNRVQQERHSDVSGPSTFSLSRKHLRILKPDCLILNPGPRREEMPADIKDPRIKMLEQVENGLYVRMALLRHIFSQNAK